MRSFILFVLVSACCATAQASSNFVSNPYLPYPPGCAQLEVDDAVPFLEDTEILLADGVSGKSIPFRVSAFRSPCSEPDRSLIWVEFAAPPETGHSFMVEIPVIVAETLPAHRFLMNLSQLPNGWGSQSDPTFNQRYLSFDASQSQPGTDRLTWRFLLDNGSPLPYFNGWRLTASEYNDAFTLELRYPPSSTVSRIAVPARAAMNLEDPILPLSGRLSGNWVTTGAADQGIAIAISARVFPDPESSSRHLLPPLVVFLAHYTYDSEGALLWLTGAADILPGAQTVDIPMEHVTDGAFLAARPAHRRAAGSVRLTVVSCNDIRLEYDYEAVGLGRGERQLERLFSLETAGFDCRDYEARMAANR